MKKLFLVLCLILLPTLLYAGGGMMVGIVGGGTPAAAGGSGTFGQEAVGSSSGSCEAYILAYRFQNLTGGTGTAATISLWIDADSAATAAKVAIYADAAGPSPGTLLGSSAEFNPSGYTPDAWHDYSIDLGANTLANNGYFWLAMWANTSAIVYAREATGGTHAYYSIAYTGTWPNPLNEDGTGANLGSIHCDITW